MTVTTPKPTVLAVMGPTASGKTALAIGLHEALGADIISVDSALVYRGMDIGTAKPDANELRRAPHRLIDIRDPAEPYSAADFLRDATLEIESILAAGRTPLLVGGTMLYFKVLLEGLSPMPPVDPRVRAEIEARADTDGWPSMHAQLAKIDPATAACLHPNHSQRISRALEVYQVSGLPISEWRAQHAGGLLPKYDWVQIAVAPQEREVLHQRIAERFDNMLAQGFIEEVRGLFERGDLHSDLPSIRAVGYRQAWQHLNGEITLTEMRDKGIVATRQLAKRQLTWLRSWHGLNWINTSKFDGQPLSSCEILRKTLNIVGRRAI